MEKFALGEIKILICTNIVESGLDIQNANTIIIQDVQHFGLAQLYQVLFLLISPYSFLFRCYHISCLLCSLQASFRTAVVIFLIFNVLYFLSPCD